MTPQQIEQLKKMPQWVQREFSRLEDSNKRLNTLIDTMKGDRHGQIEVYSKGHTFRVPSDARITFNFNSFNKMQMNMSLNRDDIEVFGDVEGIAVIPESANHIHIRPKVWRRTRMYENEDSNSRLQRIRSHS